MKKLYTALLLALVYMQVNAQCTTNYLTNPSFEAPIQPSLGNNFPAPYNVFAGWSILTASPTVQIGGFNVVRVNGSVYSGGPNNAHNGGNQYVDINGAGGYVQQSITVTCGSVIEYSGWFSRREPGGAGFTGYMDLLDASNNVISTSNTVSFTSNEDEEVWKQVNGLSVGVLPGVYTVRFFMDDYANVDDAFLCVSPGCVLSTKFNDFNVTSAKCTAKLTWVASDEAALKQYDVQMSEDGVGYKNVGMVLPKSLSASNSYDFVYNTVKAGKAFFRVRSTDVDGKIAYSKVTPANLNCNETVISIYPNPVADVLHINVTNGGKALLYTVDGRLMGTHLLTNGDNSIDIKKLSKGIYVVKVTDNLKTEVRRITKM
jgi:hypothetical protein